VAGRPPLLIDIDGVLVTSWQPIPGAIDALVEVRRRRLPFVLVTNTTSRTRDDIARLLVDAGFDVQPDEILTTAAITAAYLRRRHPGATVQLLNEGDLRPDLDGIEVVERGGDVVVLGGAGPSFTYDAVNAAFATLDAGAPLVAMNPNLVWRTAEGLQLDAGAYLHALEAATGVSAVVTGKPAEEFFQTALDHLDAAAGEASMIGDDLQTDVLGAQAVGIRGVLVRTGKYRAEQVQGSAHPPDVIIDSFADVLDLFDARSTAGRRGA
jgi:HAD superfamily hydrolase (TIGR01458 family)